MASESLGTQHASHVLDRVAGVRRHEWPAVLAAFAYFFCLLCGYYVLRPVRDEMGIQAGLKNLPWLFTATLVAMLLAVPVFGWLSARFPRRQLLPMVYVFFAANLAVFHQLFSQGVAVADTARAFFVWVSVFNLFVVSVFWSFMADLFRTEQAKRLYGLIAAGGSCGAITGPLLSALSVGALGIPNLLLLSAAFLGGAVACIVFLGRWARGQAAGPGLQPGVKDTHSTPDVEVRVIGRGAGGGIGGGSGGGMGRGMGGGIGRGMGGGIWDGVTLVLRSRFLLGICGFVILYSMLSTLLYFQQQRIVAATYADPAQRTALFAGFDLAVNSLTLVLQIFVFNRLLKGLGLAAGLVLIPLLSVLGFLALALDPVLAVLAVFGVLRRAGEFAIAKPAREALFNALSPAEKYKAKNFMDTAIYRTGDAVSAWLFEGLKSLGLSGVALVAAGGAVLWALLGRWLTRAHDRILEQRQ